MYKSVMFVSALSLCILSQNTKANYFEFVPNTDPKCEASLDKRTELLGKADGACETAGAACTAAGEELLNYERELAKQGCGTLTEHEDPKQDEE